MLRTLASSLHEGRLGLSASRRSTSRSLTISKICYSDAQPTSSPPAPEGAKKRRKRMTSVAKQEAEPVRASILQEGKLLKELRDIERPGQKLTIEDVEQYRPRHRTPDPTSRSYPEEYQKVLQRLEKAFSRGQFYEIAKLFGELSPPVNKPKRVYATLVLEKWGWPSPSKTRTIEKGM